MVVEWKSKTSRSESEKRACLAIFVCIVSCVLFGEFANARVVLAGVCLICVEERN